MRILTLNLKGGYFDQIKAGEKVEEYRLYKEYWKKRLENMEYDELHLLSGYPHKNDNTRRIVLPWNGFIIKAIVHPHFGLDPVKVFAIRVKHEE